jgi:hypothetical protein
MNLEAFLTAAIFFLGSITVVLSIVVSWKFFKYRLSLDGKSKRLSTAISWQLLGEAVIGLGTLIFSAAAFLGVLNTWSIETQSFIRFVMFFATSATTIHLMATLNKISR